MTNKVIAIFEDNKHIKMERYENDTKVGSRQMLPADYFGSMAANLTPGALMSLLLEHRDFESSLSNLHDEGIFEDFLATVIRHVPSHFLNTGENNELDPGLVKIFRAVVENVWTFRSIDTKTLNEFMKRLSADSRIQFDANMLDLTKNLMSQLLQTPVVENEENNEKLRIARMSMFKFMYRSLTKQQQEVEKDLLYSIIAGFSPTDYSEFVKSTREVLTDHEVTDFEGVIPSGCSYVFKTNKRTVYGFELKKARYRIKFHNQFIGEIGHPRLAFFYTVNSAGFIHSMRVYALKDDGKRLNGDSELYQYPFSNVYGGGEVCWEEKRTFSFDDMSFAASGFLMANNTGHLTSGAMDYLKEFKDADFDDEKLILKGKLKDTL